MISLKTHLKENRQTLHLAAPIITGHVSQMLMGWVDTIMVGRIGIIPLAACAFANTILALCFVFGFGLLSSVSVRASEAHGAGNAENAGRTLRAGTFLAVALGVFFALCIHFALPWFGMLGQNPEVIAASIPFLIICGWSGIPVFVTAAGKSFAEAQSKPWIPFWIMLASVLLNVGLNWILIYGNLGFPALGLTGAGIATLLARIAAAAGIYYYIAKSRNFLKSRPVQWFRGKVLPEMRALLSLGLPTGLQHLCEVSAFGFASIMMGWISIDALAAHQIALTCAATTFMVPLGLSVAVSVRVAQCRGAKQYERIRPISFGALGLSVILMTIFAINFLLNGKAIASIFVTDIAVITLTAQLLVIAGIFQLFDGVQIVCVGALRGIEDVRIPMFIGFGAYWISGLPIAATLAFTMDIGARGVWWGLASGLAVAAIALLPRLIVKTRRFAQQSLVRT